MSLIPFAWEEMQSRWKNIVGFPHVVQGLHLLLSGGVHLGLHAHHGHVEGCMVGKEFFHLLYVEVEPHQRMLGCVESFSCPNLRLLLCLCFLSFLSLFSSAV